MPENNDNCNCENETWEIYAITKEDGKTIPPESSQKLFHYIKKHVKLFNDQHGMPYARFKNQEQVPLSNERAMSLFSRLYYQHTLKIPSTGTIKNVMTNILSTINETITLHNRVGIQDEEWYYDLADKDKTAVRIGKESWTIVPRPPIFREFAHQKEAFVRRNDEKPGELWKQFFEIFPPVTERSKYLLKCALHAYLVPSLACPAIVIYGPEGSGKSTAERMLNELIDPTYTSLLILPKKPEEVVQQLSQRFFAAYDNISYFSQETSDVFCQFITGGTNTKRKLYTDDQNHMVGLFGRLALNGRPLVAEASDLLRRTLLVEMDVIQDKKMVGEDVIWEKFGVLAPKLRASIFDVLCQSRKSEVLQGTSGSLSDFSRRAESVSRVLGLPEGFFFEQFDENVQDQSLESVDANPIGPHVLAFLDEHKEGVKIAVSELLADLNRRATEDEKRQPGWPKKAHKLRMTLVTLKRPIFKLYHLGIRFGRNNSYRYFDFYKILQSLESQESFNSKVIDDAKTQKSDNGDAQPPKNVTLQASRVTLTVTNPETSRDNPIIQEKKPSLKDAVRKLDNGKGAAFAEIEKICGIDAILQGFTRAEIFEPVSGWLKVLE